MLFCFWSVSKKRRTGGSFLQCGLPGRSQHTGPGSRCVPPLTGMAFVVRGRCPSRVELKAGTRLSFVKSLLSLSLPLLESSASIQLCVQLFEGGRRWRNLELSSNHCWCTDWLGKYPSTKVVVVFAASVSQTPGMLEENGACFWLAMNFGEKKCWCTDPNCFSCCAVELWFFCG